MQEAKLQISFEDDDLRRLAEDPTFTTRQWGHDLVRAFRKKVQILRSAADERDLRAMRSLRLEQLKGDRRGTSSIRLNKQFRLIIRFETTDEGRLVVVIEMGNYH